MREPCVSESFLVLSVPSTFNSLVINFFKTSGSGFWFFFFPMRIYIFAKYLEVTQGILVHRYFSYETWPLAQVIDGGLCWHFFHGSQNLKFGYFACWTGS